MRQHAPESPESQVVERCRGRLVVPRRRVGAVHLDVNTAIPGHEIVGREWREDAAE